MQKQTYRIRAMLGLRLAFVARPARAPNPPPPARITLDQAIQMALQHNHSLLATRTTVQQNQAAGSHGESAARTRRCSPTGNICRSLPSPVAGLADYLHDSTEGDVGLSYLFERGQKRQHRLQAAKDATAVTRSTVTDNERTLAFQVGPALHQCPTGGIHSRSRAAGPEELSEHCRHQRIPIQSRRHERERLS